MIEKKPEPRHVCNLPSPISFPIGTIAVCDEEDCNRRWRMGRVGFTFKKWRRTPLTFLADLFRGPGRCEWATVRERVGDR